MSNHGNVRPISSDRVAGVDRSWMDQAACQYVDNPDIFFPEGGSGQWKMMLELERQAKMVCHRCPVRIECRDYAIETRQVHGIWGGLNEDERKKFAKYGKV